MTNFPRDWVRDPEFRDPELFSPFSYLRSEGAYGIRNLGPMHIYLVFSFMCLTISRRKSYEVEIILTITNRFTELNELALVSASCAFLTLERTACLLRATRD